MKVHRPLFLAIAVLLSATLSVPDADARRGGKKEDERVSLYAEATREEPAQKYSSRLNKQLQRLQKAYGTEGEERQTIELADGILADEKAGPADRGMALMLAGSAALTLSDDAAAEKYLGKAIEENAMSNENHYSAMLGLATVYLNTDQFDKAIPLLDRMISETKTTNPDVYNLLAASYYNSDKYAEAIPVIKKALELKPEDAQLRQMLMTAYAETNQSGEALKLAEELQRSNPDDKRALMNLALLYAEADMEDKAVALLEDARKRGLLTEANDYQRLFGTYYNMGKEAEAAGVIEEGLAKGLLPADGKNYQLLAQAHYFADNIPAAIAAAQKAAPLAADGEPALLLAQILGQEDRNAESKVAAQQALAKGVKKPGEAWMAIARAEYYEDNLEGAKAAYREAAKDPQTKDQATKALAQISR